MPQCPIHAHFQPNLRQKKRRTPLNIRLCHCENATQAVEEATATKCRVKKAKTREAYSERANKANQEEL